MLCSFLFNPVFMKYIIKMKFTHIGLQSAVLER